MEFSSVSESKFLFVAYGTFIYSKALHEVCRTASYLGTSVLEDYRLTFRRFSRSGVMASITPAEGFSVPVVLWDVSTNCLCALEMELYCPKYTHKVPYCIELCGKQRYGVYYEQNRQSVLSRPTAAYMAAMLAGYEENGFDTQLLLDAEMYSIRGSAHS